MSGFFLLRDGCQLAVQSIRFPLPEGLRSPVWFFSGVNGGKFKGPTK